MILLGSPHGKIDQIQTQIDDYKKDVQGNLETLETKLSVTSYEARGVNISISRRNQRGNGTGHSDYRS